MIIKKILLINERANHFISEHPMVLPLSGVIFSIALYINGLEVVVLMPFWGLIIGWRRMLRIFLPLCITIYGALFLYIGDLSFKGSLKGRARLHFHEVNFSSSTFGRSWVYKGIITQFEAKSSRKLRRLPFTLYLPKGIKPFKANGDYWVEGELLKSDFYGYKLKVAKDASFVRVAKSQCMAQKRYELKKKFRRFINKHIPFKNGRTLLIGMATGDFQDNFLSFTFSRFGLNHLLAISGFHFAILALFLTALLKFVPLKLRLFALAVSLSLFYFFVGYGPSLSRAWIVALVYLWSLYQKRLVTSVNVLSIAMVIVLILNPFMINHLGFQFSFMVTFGILIYYRPCFIFLKKVFPTVSLVDEAILKSLALGCAVHIAALPISLFHFHKFYWMGFIFNLIVPLIVSFILFSFMSALFLSLIFPTVASYGLYTVGYAAEKLVQIIYWVPTSIDYCLRVPFFPSVVMQIYIFLFFLIGANLQKQKETFHIKYGLN